MQDCQWKINEIDYCRNVADMGQFKITWLNSDKDPIYIEILYLCGIHLRYLDEDPMIESERID